jgi:hypothetical protein
VSAKTCHHVLTNGRICRALALRGQLFCYYHSRDRRRLANIRAAARRRQELKLADVDIAVIASLNLPMPDDPVAIQVCIAGILQAMMTGAISGALGGRLLYGLHIAKCTLRDSAAFNQRFAAPEEPADTVPIAASDPEPIPALDPADVDEVELAKYFEMLQIDEIPIPDSASEDPRTDCVHDEQFREIIDLLDVPQQSKTNMLKDLDSKAAVFRKIERRSILNKIKEQLAASKPKRRATAAAKAAVADVDEEEGEPGDLS